MHNILVRKPETGEKRTLAWAGHRFEENTIMAIKQMVCKGVLAEHKKFPIYHGT
jgi:hypothetical protein